MDGVAQDEADDDDGEGLPVGDAVRLEGIGLVIAFEGGDRPGAKRTPQKRDQGKSQTRWRLQKR